MVNSLSLLLLLIIVINDENNNFFYISLFILLLVSFILNTGSFFITFSIFSLVFNVIGEIPGIGDNRTGSAIYLSGLSSALLFISLILMINSFSVNVNKNKLFNYSIHLTKNYLFLMKFLNISALANEIISSSNIFLISSNVTLFPLVL